MSSGITAVEHLPDGARVHYRLQKPWGEQNVDGYFLISYGDVSKLPLLSPLQRTRLYTEWLSEVEIPSLGQSVFFVFHSYQERSGGPNEEIILGPFRK